MADQIIEVVGPGSTVEVVDEGAVQVIEIDAGGRAGPRGPAGPAGATGPQGAQGRFNLQIFARFETAPTAAPSGGSFNIPTGVLTAPTGWSTNVADAPGTGDLYVASSAIDPFVQSGIVTPTWSIPFEAGGTGPPGMAGDAIEVFYAADASGTSATTTYNGQSYIAFVEYPSDEAAPTTPPAGTVWLEFVGPQGNPGEDIIVFYADDSSGTGATTTYSNQNFIAFVEYTAGGTPPTTPPAGTVWLRFVGPSGLGIPYLTASSIPTTPQELVAATEYHIRVSNLTNDDLATATGLFVDSLGVPTVELDISRGVASGDTAYFTWTPGQGTINTLINGFGSRTALDVVLRFGSIPNNVDVTIVDDVADRLQVNTTYDLSAEGSATQNAADIRLTGSDTSTDNVTLVGANGLMVARDANVITLTGGGGPAPHAQLVPEFSILPTSITLPILGTQTVTGTATAMIRDGASRDIVNTVEITSVHATLNNGNITIRNPDPLTDTTTFTWTVGNTQTTATTVTFTCSFTVNYTIDGNTLQHSFTETANLPIIAAPVPFWTGTLTDTQVADLDALSDAQIRAALTEMSNFSAPFTSAYTGAAAPTNLHAALYVPQEFAITQVVSEGFVLEFESENEPAASRTLYVTRGPISEGTHNVTWRTS